MVSLDPITFNEAALFTCIRVHQIHKWRNASIFFNPFIPHVGPLDLLTCIEAASLYCYTGPLDPRWDSPTQKVRVTNINHEKSNISIS